MKNIKHALSGLVITVSVIFDPTHSLGNRNRNQRAKTVPAGPYGSSRTYYSPASAKFAYRTSEEHLGMLESLGATPMLRGQQLALVQQMMADLGTILKTGVDHVDPALDKSLRDCFAGTPSVDMAPIQKVMMRIFGGKVEAPEKSKNGKGKGKGKLKDTSELADDESDKPNEPKLKPSKELFALTAQETHELLKLAISTDYTADKMKKLKQDMTRQFDVALCGRFLTQKEEWSSPGALTFGPSISLLPQQSSEHLWAVVDQISGGHGGANLGDEMLVGGWHYREAYLIPATLAEASELQGDTGAIAEAVSQIVVNVCRHLPRQSPAKGNPEIIGCIVTVSKNTQPLSCYNLGFTLAERSGETLQPGTFIREYAEAISNKYKKFSTPGSEAKVLGYVSSEGESNTLAEVSERVREYMLASVEGAHS